MPTRKTSSRSVLNVLSLLAALVVGCERRNRASEPIPPPQLAPMPMPPPTPGMAPAPMPTAGGDPAAQSRAQIVAVLDQIEAQLVECESSHMEHVEPQARRIQDLVGQMAIPIAAFPRAAAPYAQMQSHASRFTEACARNRHHDVHEHHAHLRQSAAAVRAAL